MGPTGSIEVMLRSLTVPTIKDREVSLWTIREARRLDGRTGLRLSAQ